jgi:hypothetical protein
LVVYEPTQGLVRDVLLCEDGHAQERSLFGEGLQTVHAGALWIADRNCCTREFRGAIDTHGAVFIMRQHEGLPFALGSGRRSVGRSETGHVAEQRVQVWDAQGGAHLCRRLQVKLDQATRDGDRVRYILTNVPLRKASAKRVARLDRKRWTLETAFQPLEASFHAAINTLGYPKAALCGFGLALVAYTRRQRHHPNVSRHDDGDPGGRVAGLQLHAACGDGGSPEGVGPAGAPQSVSQKFSRVEEPPAETRRYHQIIPCLDRQNSQESTSQCSDTLTGLHMKLEPDIDFCNGFFYTLAEEKSRNSVCRINGQILLVNPS